MIYFVEVPSGPIKIGRSGGSSSSSNMKQRLGALRIEFQRDDLRAIFFMPERRGVTEAALLARMRPHHLGAEWHDREPTLALIDELCGRAPLLAPDDPINERVVQVKVSGAEIERISNAAAAAGQTVREWLRAIALAEAAEATQPGDPTTPQRRVPLRVALGLPKRDRGLGVPGGRRSRRIEQWIEDDAP